MADLRHAADIRQWVDRNSLLNIAVHSTTAAAMRVTAASFDSRADGQWKSPLRLSPVTHRAAAKLEKSLAPLMEKRPRIGELFARESQRRLVSRLDRPQPGLFSPDIVAGGRCEALPFRHLNLEH